MSRIESEIEAWSSWNELRTELKSGQFRLLNRCGERKIPKPGGWARYGGWGFLRADRSRAALNWCQELIFETDSSWSPTGALACASAHDTIAEIHSGSATQGVRCARR